MISELFIYSADEFHGECVVERLIGEGELAPAARDMPPGEALWWGAQANAIDMEDERTYDSGEWPKRHDGELTYDDMDGEGARPRSCGWCLMELAGPAMPLGAH